jgi:hypothetical protein
MHEPQLTTEQSAQVASLLTCDGWPLIVTLFADSEFMQLEAIRSDPLAPEAQAAAVKLAHIEELRGLIRSITPSFIGDPFDGTRLSRTGDGPETGPDPDPPTDDYDLS